jgi:hypothetical protein
MDFANRRDFEGSKGARIPWVGPPDQVRRCESHHEDRLDSPAGGLRKEVPLGKAEFGEKGIDRQVSFLQLSCWIPEHHLESRVEVGER